MDLTQRLWNTLVKARTYISTRTADGRIAANLVERSIDELSTKEWVATPPSRHRAAKIASYELWGFWDVWSPSSTPNTKRNAIRFKTMALITEDRILNNVLPNRISI